MRATWFSLLAVSCVLACSSDNVSSSDQTTSSTTSTDDTSTSTTGSAIEGDCIHTCMFDSDCNLGGAINDYTCVDGECTPPTCESDEECVVLASGWLLGPPCTPGGGECDPFETSKICLDVLGEGHCVSAPSDFFECAEQFEVEIQTVDIDGNPVVVCGKDNAMCDGVCKSPCLSDDYCFFDSSPICNVDTGLCGCGSDADCQTLDSPAFAVCTPDGRCGCTDDQQCIDEDRGDVCTSAGICGCTNDMACREDPFPWSGGTHICVLP